ncbi:hypothetical protein CPB84DRAFT_1764021 [Gymnopilus junonius]|uniref:Ubiquinone biosynthesis protein n=1 Tax=Gymnopilus junonius TaxID=109634 RepID=A0A9P5TS42_GYMJU|nr:hypothetical protein CPB84DRAFT_1764021 [Gymnopilus junonius]
MSSTRLLKLALPLVKTHGFTRETLSRSVLALPPTEAHAEPLSDTAVSALFGEGDEARKTLIAAWLKEGLRHMASVPGVERPVAGLGPAESSAGPASADRKATIRDVLRARLEYNEPVLPYLPEAFAVYSSPTVGFPPFDPTKALKHAASIADEACYATGDQSLQLEWYARRASVAAIYAASELHQLASPNTAYSFLDSLLDTSSSLRKSVNDIGLYSEYIFRSWKGIIKSSGIL